MLNPRFRFCSLAFRQIRSRVTQIRKLFEVTKDLPDTDSSSPEFWKVSDIPYKLLDTFREEYSSEEENKELRLFLDQIHQSSPVENSSEGDSDVGRLSDDMGEIDLE